MKCVNCGAVLQPDQLLCPYCGAPNAQASDRQKELDAMEQKNRTLKREVLAGSKWEIIYKIHKRVNIVLFCIFALTMVISFGIFLLTEGHVLGHKGTETEMLRYYEEGDYEKLYLCMNSGELFDPEKNYDYSHIALLWRSYENCQLYFAEAFEEYEKTGLYSTYDLEQCIKEGCEVLTGNCSYVYPALSATNQEKFAPYQEQVRILFTGALQIPEKMLEDLDTAETYKREDPLIEYVLEVLPNE